jgi:hypothetical protein
MTVCVWSYRIFLPSLWSDKSVPKNHSVTYKECGAEGHTFLALEVHNLLHEVTIAFVSLKVALKRVELAKYI